MKTFKKALSDHLDLIQEEGFISNYEENDFNAGIVRGFEQGFKAGVEHALQWISVDDELPQKVDGYKDSEAVLVKDSYGNYHAARYNYELECWEDNGFGELLSGVTHWKIIE
jgi:hypothetical protein